MAGTGAVLRRQNATIVVGYSAGGGYDIYARTWRATTAATSLAIPIIAEHAGAASMTAAVISMPRPKDGTVITTFDPGLITQMLTSDKPVVLRLSMDRHTAADIASAAWARPASRRWATCSSARNS
jgi:tripartite-type tricarboxylate transporter receptor subunit TctC